MWSARKPERLHENRGGMGVLRRLPRCDAVFHRGAMAPLHLVAFSLDTTGWSSHNSRQRCAFCWGIFADHAAGGEKRCSICPGSPFNALMYSAICAATGYAPTPPARSSTTAAVRAAVTCCATCRRLSAPASVCAHARSPRGHLFDRARARSAVLK
jgi:rubredoxin